MCARSAALRAFAAWVWKNCRSSCSEPGLQAPLSNDKALWKDCRSSCGDQGSRGNPGAQVCLGASVPHPNQEGEAHRMACGKHVSTRAQWTKSSCLMNCNEMMNCTLSLSDASRPEGCAIGAIKTYLLWLVETPILSVPTVAWEASDSVLDKQSNGDARGASNTSQSLAGSL